MVAFNLFISITVCFACFINVVSTEDVCVQKGPCLCEFSNGTGYDLSPTAKNSFYMTKTYEVKNNGSQYSLRSYFYHPCYDVQPKFNTTNSYSTCGKPLSICGYTSNLNIENVMQNKFKMDSGIYEFMGSSNVTKFSADGRSITYLNGPSSTVVMLICTQTTEELHTYSLQEPDRIVLAFYSPDACLKQLKELVSTEDVCVQKGPCSCVFTNGTGYDLWPTAKKSFYMTQTYEVNNNGSQYSLSSYFYHPCYDVQPKFNTTNSYSTCGKPLSVCRYISNFNIENVMQNTFKRDSGFYEFMGSSNDTKFSADGQSIIYLNGPSLTVVMLICAQTTEELHTYSLQEPDRIVLAFYSPDACLKQLKERGPLNNVIPART